MNIVVLDLEWNTTFFKSKNGYVNEIIEFGAVKLDENLRETDSFSALVNSNKKHLLRPSVEKMTNISNGDLLKDGLHFSSVASMFRKWAGEDSIIATWSKSDIFSLIENCQVYLSTGKIPFLNYYIDLQAFVQERLKCEGKNQIGLLSAAGMMNVEYDDSAMHRALNDSRLSAGILRKCFDRARFFGSVVDAASAEFYERLFYKPHIENNIKSPYISGEDFVFTCDNCNNVLKIKSRWKYKNKFFNAQLCCNTCGQKYVGHVQVKKTYDNVLIKRNLTAYEGAGHTVSKQNELAAVSNE